MKPNYAVLANIKVNQMSLLNLSRTPYPHSCNSFSHSIAKISCLIFLTLTLCNIADSQVDSSGTALFILLNKGRLTIATERGVGSGGKVTAMKESKINEVNGTYITATGYSTFSDVLDTIRTDTTLTLKEQVAKFEALITPRLTAYCERSIKKDGIKYFDNDRNGDPLFIFFARRAKSQIVYIALTFRMVAEDGGYVLKPFFDSCLDSMCASQTFYTIQPSTALQQFPDSTLERLWRNEPAMLCCSFIRKAIDMEPKKYLAPIDVLLITPESARWYLDVKDCKNIKYE